MIYFAATHTGRRKNNEDSMFAPNGPDGFFAVVADGMGGHNAGEVASRIVVDTIVDALNGADLPERVTAKDIENMLIAANTAVYDNAKKNRERLGMGSTATVAVFKRDSMIVGQVGDSRAYLLSNGQLSQITKDHSYVQLLIDKGYITQEEAQYHPQKNIITRALGTEEAVQVDTITVPLGDGDTVLLCTDGLNGVVPDNSIADILRAGINTAADSLVEAALASGGRDNITVIIAQKGGDCV